MRRAAWTECSVRGEGIACSGEMAGIELSDRLSVSANGVDYVVVVLSVTNGSRWQAIDEASALAGRSQ